MALTREILPILAADIATALGDGWSHTYDADMNRDAFRLHGPDSAEIFVASNRYGSNGKLEIHASYPRTDAYDVPTVSIGVGETRGAAVIAREITRRVLPTYLPALARVLAHNDKRASDGVVRRALASELAGVLGGRVDREDDDSTRSRVHVYNGVSADIELGHDGTSGKFTASNLSADQLRAFAALLVA